MTIVIGPENVLFAGVGSENVLFAGVGPENVLFAGVGPENVHFAGVYVCTFQPGFFLAGWGGANGLICVD